MALTGHMLERIEKHGIGERSQLGLQPLQLPSMARRPRYAGPECHLGLEILKGTDRVELWTLDPDRDGAASGITPIARGGRKRHRAHQHHPSLHHTTITLPRGFLWGGHHLGRMFSDL